MRVKPPSPILGSAALGAGLLSLVVPRRFRELAARPSIATTIPVIITGKNASLTRPHFRYALTAWNFGNGDRADLVVGIPYREVTLSRGTVRNDAGALLVLYGHTSGLGTSEYQYWTLESGGVEGSAQTLGRFGYSLY